MMMSAQFSAADNSVSNGGIMEKQKIKNFISDLTLSAIMSFSLVYAMITSLVFDRNPLGLFGIILVVTLIFSIAFFNRVTTLVSIISLTVLSVISGIIVYFMDYTERVAEEVKEFIIWIYDYIVGYDIAKGNYPVCLTILLCVSVSLYVFIFTGKFYSFPAILIFGAGTFVIQWAYGIMVSIIPFYIFVLIIPVYYMRHVFRKNAQIDANNFEGHGTFTAWMFPVSALIFIIAFIFTTFTQPIKIEWLDTKITQVINYIEETLPGKTVDYFSVASTGFGRDKGRLGGRVRLDDSIALVVETPRNIYLKGASYGIYTGLSWEESEEDLYPTSVNVTGNVIAGQDIFENQNNIAIDLMECSLGPVVLDESSIPFTENKDPQKRHVYKDDIKITYQEISLKSLFLPLKAASLNISQEEGISLFISSNDALSMDKRKGSGFTYSVTSYNFDYGNDYFKDLLRKSKKGLYREYLSRLYQMVSNEDDYQPAFLYSVSPDNSIMVSCSAISGNPVDLTRLISLLALHSDYVYSKYLQLPDTLPDRVKELATDITRNFDNNYDKVKAIENYLAENYLYTLNPGRTPKERDFVDYFLFELQKGYCTYYASAMTVLTRCIGLPARYVEGYILPPKPVENTFRTYHVTNQQAHAWVEVYFEGFGWVPFEPTSPFTSPFYSSYEVVPEVAEGFLDDLLYEKYYEMLEEYRNKPGNIDIDLPALPEPDEKVISMEMILAGFASLLIVLLISVIMFNYSRGKVRLYNLRKLEPRESVLEAFKYYFKVLALQGLGIKPGETPSEYSHRVSNQILFERFGHKGESLSQFMDRINNLKSLYNQSRFISVTEIFVKARYSLEEITEKEKQLVYSYHESLEMQARDNLGKIRFFIYKYLLGWI